MDACLAASVLGWGGSASATGLLRTVGRLGPAWQWPSPSVACAFGLGQAGWSGQWKGRAGGASNGRVWLVSEKVSMKIFHLLTIN